MQRAKGYPLVVALMLILVAIPSVPAIKSLRSLATFRKVDDYPLYVMHLYGSYGFDEFLESGTQAQRHLLPSEPGSPDQWACSVFAALNKDGDLLLGRNFDWFNRPSLLLFTHPSHGFDSVSMVDISYFGFDTDEPSWSDRLELLDAPYWPFDGMNERGLAVGMMAVPFAEDNLDPQRVTVGSLHAIRLLLDNAGTVDEAISLLQGYNVDFEGGPPLHYLVADALGNSAVIEFIDGAMRVLPNEGAWQVATNFVISGHSQEEARGLCRRYATANEALEQAGGSLSPQQAMELLEDVSQAITMWSIVYNMSSGDISVAMGRDYDQVREFQLKMRSQ